MPLSIRDEAGWTRKMGLYARDRVAKQQLEELRRVQTRSGSIGKLHSFMRQEYAKSKRRSIL